MQVMRQHVDWCRPSLENRTAIGESTPLTQTDAASPSLNLLQMMTNDSCSGELLAAFSAAAHILAWQLALKTCSSLSCSRSQLECMLVSVAPVGKECQLKDTTSGADDGFWDVLYSLCAW
jgi:hypothetical protein